MAYIGKEPAIGNFVKLDAISTSSTNTYNLTLDSVAFTPESANHMLVSLNGVIQAPQTSFSVSGSTITFLPSSGTLSSSDSIDFIMVYGNVLDIGTPSDSTVTNAKTNFVSTSSAAGLQIKGDGTTDGTLQLNCSQNSHGIKLKSPAHSAGQSYTLTFPTTAPSADKALITDGSGNLSFGDAGGGKVLQVVQSVKSDTASWSAHATTPVASGLSASITPSATGSKVLVQYMINIGYPSNGSQFFLHLFRGSTEINQGDAASSRKRAHNVWGGSYQGNAESYMSHTHNGVFLDSPSTTSSTTYSIKHTDATGSGTYYINRSTEDRDNAGYDPRFVSNIILMEIGA